MEKKLYLIFVFMIITSIIFGVDTVIYPKISSKDTRFLDLIEILETSLEKTKSKYGDYELKPSSSMMNERRWVVETKAGEILNLMWGTANKDTERQLAPIYIPVRKGILGYRIFLIRKEDQAKFSAINSVEELKKYSVGQGADWADMKVFRANKFKAVGGSSYEGLFPMLAQGRFDFFSRGANEAYPEYEARKNKIKNLHVEESITLFYPWPYLFYVSPKNPKLAERIEKGLRIMIDDGSLDEIFFKYNGETIKKSNLKGRKLFKIDNPDLSEKIDQNDEKLWFDPYK